MTTIDSNNCIPRGLRVDVMRCSMENKNLLTTKGSIYVGAGSTVSVGGQSIPKTKALALGAEGAVLMSKNGDLAYSKLANDNFDGSTNYSNLEKTFNDYKVVNSNFSADVSYQYLDIFNDNIVEGADLSNVVIVPSDGISCDIMNSYSTFSKNRKVVLRQGSSGKLELFYNGLGKNVTKHDVVLALTWEPSYYSSITSYLFFTFVDGYNTSNNMDTYLDFEHFLKQVVAEISITETSDKIVLRPNAVYHSTAPQYQGDIVFRVAHKDNISAGNLVISIGYYNASRDWLEYVLEFSSSNVKIDSQSVSQLISG